MTMTEPVGAERAAIEAKRGLGPITRDFADLDAWRVFTIDDFEIRSAPGSGSLSNFYGHASTTGRAYPMFGGPEKGGWNETIDPGAFKRTLSQNPDTVFLLNHTGMTMARTKPGTLRLAEDSVGLEVTKAELNRDISAINDMVLQIEARNLDEMSFGFRIIDQLWLDASGQEVPWWDMSGVDRHITEVSIHHGDVSVVNYGANPFTDASMRGARAAMPLPDLRAFAGALQEVRAGAVLSDATRSTLQTVLDAMSGAEDDLDEAQQTLSDLLGVANPDDMPDDGMMAAMQLEVERRAFVFRHTAA